MSERVKQPTGTAGPTLIDQIWQQADAIHFAAERLLRDMIAELAGPAGLDRHFAVDPADATVLRMAGINVDAPGALVRELGRVMSERSIRAIGVTAADLDAAEAALAKADAELRDQMPELQQTLEPIHRDCAALERAQLQAAQRRDAVVGARERLREVAPTFLLKRLANSQHTGRISPVGREVIELEQRLRAIDFQLESEGPNARLAAERSRVEERLQAKRAQESRYARDARGTLDDFVEFGLDAMQGDGSAAA